MDKRIPELEWEDVKRLFTVASRVKIFASSPLYLENRWAAGFARS